MTGRALTKAKLATKRRTNAIRANICMATSCSKSRKRVTAAGGGSSTRPYGVFIVIAVGLWGRESQLRTTEMMGGDI